MMSTHTEGKVWIWVVGTVATLFGVLTIKEGGSVLFWSEEARRAAGQYVPFVVWFNFLAGFAYIAAGLGILLWWRSAAGLAVAIAASTLIIFAALGVYIAGNGAYEVRTVVAMGLRSAVWIAVALVAYRFIWKLNGKADS